MTVECPKCGAKATFDEKRFVGKSKVQGRCPKCNQSFVVALPAAAATGTPGPPPPPVAAIPGRLFCFGNNGVPIDHHKRAL